MNGILFKFEGVAVKLFESGSQRSEGLTGEFYEESAAKLIAICSFRFVA